MQILLETVDVEPLIHFESSKKCATLRRNNSKGFADEDHD
jgi:hypothetical protein